MTLRPAALLMVLACLASAASGRAAEAPAPQAVAWLKARATPAGGSDAPVGRAEAAAIARLMTGATVVAFGEPSHGNREPLEYRNRLIRHLVEHEGVRVVGLETGIAGGRRVHDFIAGGAGDAASVVRANLNWGFNQLDENVALVAWLRAWNDTHPGDRVAFYGYDVTGGDTKDEMGGAAVALRDVRTFLAKADPGGTAALRATLERLEPSFTSAGWRALATSDREALGAALKEARRRLEVDRAALVSASSPDDYDWAREEALDCDRLLAIFAAWPDYPTDWKKLFAVSDVRDVTMADHVGWILRREGLKARMLMFAANGHVVASALIWDMWKDLHVTMREVGSHLRERMGDRYRVIVSLPHVGPSSEGQAPPADKLNSQLAAAGSAPMWVDLRGASEQAAWSKGFDLVSPALPIPNRPPKAFDTLSTAPGAFDAVLFLDSLTPEPRKP